MGLIKSLLILLVPTFLLAFAALNGFLGQPAQAKMENFILSVMGESRGSYFIKNMTPLKDMPLREQTSQLVDQGQAAFVSGRKTGDDVVGSVGRTTDNVAGSVGNILGGDK